MRILTNYISSVMLRQKNLEIQNIVKAVKSRGKKTECHEIEPNPSKDGTMHEGDDPLF
jgi:hypothetical protein